MKVIIFRQAYAGRSQSTGKLPFLVCENVVIQMGNEANCHGLVVVARVQQVVGFSQ
jgi:hypothetical protein